MSEHEPIGDSDDDTSVDALPLVQIKGRVAADNDGAVSSIPPTDWSGSETAAIHFPLVQMQQLAHAIESGSDEEVRRMHGVFLDVFSAGRRNFLHFLESLNIQVNTTPTAAYVVDTDGNLLPIADMVTEVFDAPANGDFLGLAGDYNDSESPVFSLTRVKSGADLTDDIHVYWDEGGSARLEEQIAALDELVLEELNTGDEVTARKLPPVEMIQEPKDPGDGLPDFSVFAELLPTTPPPGGVFTITPSYSSYDQSTPIRDTRVLISATKPAIDQTPTPRRPNPPWLMKLFVRTAEAQGLENIPDDELKRIVEDEQKSAE